MPHYRKKSLDAAVGMYEGGMSAGQIAKIFGVGRRSIYGSLKCRGVKFRPQLRIGKDNHFYRGKNPFERKALLAVFEAVKKGKMARVSMCESCGSGNNIRAHHDDYNKPLSVRWLCQKCHFDWHKSNIPIAVKNANRVYPNKFNRFIKFNGAKKTLKEWSEQIGVSMDALSYRLKNWDFHRAMTEEVHTDKRRRAKQEATDAVKA